MHTLTVRHNFETAHRLPHLGGKCTNLHGHSWWAEVTLTAPSLRNDGTIVDFGAAKGLLRKWIDEHLDHGVMLGAADPLVAAFKADGTKLFRFGAADPREFERLAVDLPYPTVELVAELLGRVAAAVVVPLRPSMSVARVRVSETHVNTAEWGPQ